MKTTGLDFIEAVKAAKLWQKVRRKHWHPHAYIYEADNKYMQRNKSQYNFGFGDYVGEDWEIFVEPPQAMSFQEALQLFKQGKTIRRLNGNGFRYCYCPNHPHMFSIQEIEATDWIVAEE